MAQQLTDIELTVQALEDELIRRNLDDVLWTQEWCELKKQARKDGSELETLREYQLEAHFWGDFR